MAKRTSPKPGAGEVVVKFEKPYGLYLLDDGPPMETVTSKEDLLGFYREMSLMRRIEIAADVAYKQKQIRGFLHLYNGQEAVAAGLENALTPADHVITAYRCHAHMVSRRCNTSPDSILAELFGKQSGCSEGKGGSMHMYNEKTHFHGGNGIVGAQVPLGTGIAFSQKLLGTGNVVMSYYGDGAANQGQIFEAYNMAALWKLPCIYICENNAYAMGTSVERSSATKDFHSRSHFLPGIQFDGMNVLQTREVGRFAVEHAKTKGPIILEAKTYRYKGHSMSDPGITYRTRNEVDGVRETRDPIDRVTRYLLEFEFATEAELKTINEEVKALVDEAVRKAQTAEVPKPEELFTDVYIKNDIPIRGTEQWHNGFAVPSSY